MRPSVAEQCVAHLSLSERPITKEVARHVREHVADTLAVAVAARSAPELRRLVLGTVRGSYGSCDLLIDSRAAPPAQAAFLNAAAAHLLDFDDIHDTARLHPTPVVLAAALAAAQLARTPGDTLVHAIAAGTELMCRMGVALRPTGSGRTAHWFTTQLLGYAGSALTAGLALGLDPASLSHAIGLSTMQAAGAKQAGNGVGSNARAIYPGFAAAGGLTAALLAAEGMRGPKQAIEGADGLLAAYLGSSDLDLAWETAPGWRCLETVVKPWPCCRISHPYVSAALNARRSLGERSVDEVRSILIEVNPSAAKLCTPLSERRTPSTIADAKYSIPFLTALTLRHGAPDLRLTDPTCLEDTSVLDTARMTHAVVTFTDRPGHPQARLTLALPDNSTVTATSDPRDLAVSGAAALCDKIGQCLGHDHDAGAHFLFAVTRALDDCRPGAADRLFTVVSGELHTTASGA